MKRLILIFALFLPSAASADSTARYLWNTCQGNSSGGNTSGEAYSSCWGYLGGVREFHRTMWWDAAGIDPLFCPPVDFTGENYGDLVVDFIKRYQPDLDESLALTIAVSALKEAYPCQPISQ